MEYKFTCSSCGQHIAVTDDLVGSQANCPSCSTLLTIPPPKTSTSRFSIVLAAAASVAAITFAVLWLLERDKSPIETVKEVETIKHVTQPGQVIEVPAKLTDAQQAAIEFSSRFFSAPAIATADDALYKLDSINVQVFLNDAVKKVLSEDRVKNKFELILRQHNIVLDEKAPVWLEVAYEGLWDKNGVVLTYAPRMRLQQAVTIGRKGDLRRTIATVWQEGAYGYAGSQVVEEAILKDVEAKAESFANRFLNVQAKTK